MANTWGNSEFKSEILRWPFYLMNLLRYTCQNGRERATLRETKEYGTWMWSLGKGQSLIYYWVVFVGSIVVVFGDQQNSILGDNPRSNIPWLYTIVPCKSFPQKKTLHSLYILSSPPFASWTRPLWHTWERMPLKSGWWSISQAKLGVAIPTLCQCHWMFHLLGVGKSQLDVTVSNPIGKSS